MNASRLLEHFDRISEAPDAIPKLRKFILDLAVRGKLVEQDPADEDATRLIERIEREWERRARAGELKKSRILPAIDGDEVPFVLPTGWQWARIRQVTTDRGQIVPSSEFTYIDVTSINKEVGYIAEPKVLSASEAPSRARKIVAHGDVIYSCVRPYLLNIAVIDRDIIPSPIASTAFAVLNGFGLILPRYLWIALRSPAMVEQVEGKMRGQAYPAINDGDFGLLPLPIPPLAEQRRIVAKVDELMGLCERLDAAQVDCKHQRRRLVASSVGRLGEPDTDMARNRFCLEHLPLLIRTRSDVDQLRQSVLCIAVSGQLTQQGATDEPVETLLARADEARRITARDDHRADEDHQELLGGEDKWSVPTSWQWRGLADLVLFIDYRGQTPVKTSSGVPLITAKNVRRGFISRAPEEFLSVADYAKWMTRGIPKPEDVLFTTEAPMGNAAVVRMTERFALAQRVICFHGYGATDPDFLAVQLLSAPFQAVLEKAATGLTAKGIKAAKLKRLPIAVPPRPEQQRIVRRVSELMGLCDLLEAQIDRTQAAAPILIDALLHEALAIGA